VRYAVSYFQQKLILIEWFCEILGVKGYFPLLAGTRRCAKEAMRGKRTAFSFPEGFEIL